MDYSIFNERLLSLSNGTVSVVVELVAASSEDIPLFDAIDKRVLMPGSFAIVPSEKKLYILDADQLWTEWGTGTKITAPESDDNEGDDNEEEEQNA